MIFINFCFSGLYQKARSAPFVVNLDWLSLVSIFWLVEKMAHGITIHQDVNTIVQLQRFCVLIFTWHCVPCFLLLILVSFRYQMEIWTAKMITITHHLWDICVLLGQNVFWDVMKVRLLCDHTQTSIKFAK